MGFNAFKNKSTIINLFDYNQLVFSLIDTAMKRFIFIEFQCGTANSII